MTTVSSLPEDFLCAQTQLPGVIGSPVANSDILNNIKMKIQNKLVLLENIRKTQSNKRTQNNWVQILIQTLITGFDFLNKAMSPTSFSDGYMTQKVKVIDSDAKVA